MPSAPIIISVALPVPLRRTFDYLADETTPRDKLLPGIRVRVPFGSRQLVGIVISTDSRSTFNNGQLKSIEQIIDETPVLSEELFSLCRWCSAYYQHPLGEVIQAALPTLVRKGDVIDITQEKHYRLTEQAPDLDHPHFHRASRQAAVVSALQQSTEDVGEHALKSLSLLGAPFKALLDKGWVEEVQPKSDDAETAISAPPQILAEAPLTLNEGQENVMTHISPCLGSFHCFLLEGITGSGKTEIYLQLIHQVLERDLSTLVLVPEIGLTPQTVARFEHRFTVPVALMHSGLTDRERLHTWHKASTGEARIILGTRSAVFAPSPSLGLIIIDEEHDLSYKQQDGFRYSARDVAIKRARDADIPVLLGSATPSLETLHNALGGRYQHLFLNARAGSATLPQVQLLDIRSRPLDEGFCTPLIKRIQMHIDNGGQVLVFINRRGFAPTLMCHECGWNAPCSRCDSRMTLHLKPRHLRCHHCNTQRPVPNQCPECNHPDLNPIGIGTERSEEAVTRLFPDTPVIRVDRDSTRRKTAMQDMIAQINQGEPSILVGTQMLAKGHHFPKVTLVAILDADSGLFSSDFRGIERMAQTITQVAGRAGRKTEQGEVIIQTHQGDNPLLQSLVTEGYGALARSLLAEREQTLLPPLTHMALIRAEAVNETAPANFLTQVRRTAESYCNDLGIDSVMIMGPLPAIMARRAGHHRAQLLFQCADRKPLHNLLTPLCSHVEQTKEARQVRWSVDVDPLEIF